MSWRPPGGGLEASWGIWERSWRVSEASCKANAAEWLEQAAVLSGNQLAPGGIRGSRSIYLARHMIRSSLSIYINTPGTSVFKVGT